MAITSTSAAATSASTQAYQAISGSEKTEQQAQESREVKSDGDEAAKSSSVPSGVGRKVDISA